MQTTGTPALRAWLAQAAAPRPRRRSPRMAPAARPRRRPAATRSAAHAWLLAALQPELHQIGLERRERALERAAEPLDGLARRTGDRRALLGVGEPARRCAPRAGRRRDQLGAARGVERVVDLGEIPDMRAMQDGGAELDRLDRILPAVAHQRAAHEHDRREPIDQPELAERVGDIDVVLRLGQPPARAQRPR